MLIWDPEKTPAELHGMLTLLAEEYPLSEGKNSTLLFESSLEKRLKVSCTENVWKIAYEKGKVSSAARGTGLALAGIETEETCSFDTTGLLFDTSRGSVFTVGAFKRWLRRMALFGYNMAMIYTKDMYKLPGETYFGYMRGAYSLEELREIDSYAKALGIEMVASVQALGHMEPILRWNSYRKIRDTDSVMLVDEPATMELVCKILDFWSKAFSSRRIHLGMDETQDLGRGIYMNRHGYEKPFSLYLRHLKKVLKACEKHSFDPIIWADMFFRFANEGHDYYDLASQIPEEVRKTIPGNVRLSYWDYYHRETPIYETMLKRTTALNGSAPFMASGIWTWFSLWCDEEYTHGTVSPCIDACEKTDAKEIIFTLWADDGSYCAFDSALPSACWTAERLRNTAVDSGKVAALSKAVLGTDGSFESLASKMEYTFSDEKGVHKVNSSQLLWDDPLYGIVRRELPVEKAGLFEEMTGFYRELARKLEPYRETETLGPHAWNIVSVLSQKLELRKMLEEGYAKRDFSLLGQLRERIPLLIGSIENLKTTFRDQWLADFKPYGLEMMQIRLSGLQERYRELARVLTDLENGKISSLPQLEEPPADNGYIDKRYRMLFSGSWYI